MYRRRVTRGDALRGASVHDANMMKGSVLSNSLLRENSHFQNLRRCLMDAGSLDHLVRQVGMLQVRTRPRSREPGVANRRARHGSPSPVAARCEPRALRLGT
jgi:hypothetical protein